MMLSNEQMDAVMAGVPGTFTWREMERPVGPHPIPEWCKGAYVDWSDAYMNSPSITLKVVGSLGDWPDQCYTREGGKFYRTRHPDGRMLQYAHNGKLALDKVRMFQSEDGTIRQYRREGAQWYVPPKAGEMWPKHGPEPGDWIDVEMLCTERQGGFGGSHIHLRMEDGSTIVLRGPWHTGGPSGYTEIRYVDMTRDRQWGRKGDPWHRWGGGGGLYLRDDVLVAIMARFAAHLRLVKVTNSGRTSIEPIKPEWDVPKKVIYEREYQQRVAARKAEEATI